MFLWKWCCAYYDLHFHNTFIVFALIPIVVIDYGPLSCDRGQNEDINSHNSTNDPTFMDLIQK